MYVLNGVEGGFSEVVELRVHEHRHSRALTAGSLCVSRLFFPLLTRTTRRCPGQLQGLWSISLAHRAVIDPSSDFFTLGPEVMDSGGGAGNDRDDNCQELDPGADEHAQLARLE